MCVRVPEIMQHEHAHYDVDMDMTYVGIAGGWSEHICA